MMSTPPVSVTPNTVGTVASFLRGSLSSGASRSMSTPDTNTVIPFDSTDAQFGPDIVVLGEGSFQLGSGPGGSMTYRIVGCVPTWTTDFGSPIVSFQWFNEMEGVAFGSAQTAYTGNHGGHGSAGAPAEAFLTVSGSTPAIISFRMNDIYPGTGRVRYFGGNVDFQGGGSGTYPWFEIQVVGGAVPATSLIGATGPIGETGHIGPTGVAGATGVDGATGPAGMTGSQFIYMPGQPSCTLGFPGDTYFDKNTRIIYGPKSAETLTYNEISNSQYQWSPTPSGVSGSWTSVASSMDGTTIVLGGTDDVYIGTYTASDSHWTLRPQGIPGHWAGVTYSSDGTHIYAAPHTDINGHMGYIHQYVSGHWSPSPNAYGNWTSVACSSNGAVAVATQGSNSMGGRTVYGNLFVSTDEGAAWRIPDRVGMGVWTSSAVSLDGAVMVAAQEVDETGYAGQIWTSTDAGISWTSNGPHMNWSSVGMNSNGTLMLAAAGGGGAVYASSNFGETWTPTSQNGNRVGVSPDGTTIVVGEEEGRLAVSFDGGSNWVQQIGSPRSSWSSLALSSNGRHIVGCVPENIVVNASPWPHVSSLQGSAGVEGPAGVPGKDGLAGAPGPAGPAGSNGTSILTGHGIPTRLANVGDVYIDVSGGGLYGPMQVSNSISYGTIQWSRDSNALTQWCGVEYGNGKYMYAINNIYVYSVVMIAGSPVSVRLPNQPGGMFGSWSSIAAATGAPVVYVASSNGYVWSSRDSGTSWTDGGIHGNWSSISCSSDGMVAIATCGGEVYTTSNYGEAWTPQTPRGSCTACSSDGSVMVVGGDEGGLLHIWSNSEWSRSTQGWSTEAIAIAGDHRLFLAGPGGLAICKGSGSEWEFVTSLGGLKTVGCSDDGQYIAVSGSSVFVSSDGGCTWTPQTSLGERVWAETKVSRDGTGFLVADGSPGHLYTGRPSLLDHPVWNCSFKFKTATPSGIANNLVWTECATVPGLFEATVENAGVGCSVQYSLQCGPTNLVDAMNCRVVSAHPSPAGSITFYSVGQPCNPSDFPIAWTLYVDKTRIYV